MENASSTLQGRIVAVSTSHRKGQKKSNLSEGALIKDKGFAGDAHAGDWHRQVSLLAMESIAKIRNQGMDVAPGDFAENITTTGIEIWQLELGTRLAVGDEAELEITQIGKECHDRCAIYRQIGDCVMPREGIFARVLRGGKVKPGDRIRVLPAVQARQGAAE
ncbi:MAG: MOSC domain-containing protein [Deltaproteobacteria bacterium]|jgi:MOSC domain-containing protein YiiM